MIMPYLDGTGPNGLGPLTGRGLGYCSGAVGLGYGYGFGWGRGYGRGMAYGRRFGGWGFAPYVNAWGALPYAPLSPETQRQALANEQRILETRLEALKSQIEELEKKKSETPNN
jgi:hypothetical protein